MSRIVHMTSVHSRTDTRIALKECRAVVDAGIECVLIVADGKGDEEKDGLRILDVGAPASRAHRMTAIVRRVRDLALSLKADIYHFHDPELIPVGLKLVASGNMAIYDMHEDVTMDILSKPWIAGVLRPLVSGVFGCLERHAISKLTATITAWPYLHEKFERMGSNVIEVVNYAMADELYVNRPWVDRAAELCYVGVISDIRGIYEVMRALEICDVRLNLAGEFHEAETERRVRSMSAWEKINYHGFVDRKAAAALMARSRIGIVTFLPEQNHINAMPNKLFEYMSAGLPVIASDFPRWREIVEGVQCGICVDPEDPSAIASAVRELLGNPIEAARMGENGRRAILEKYNWRTEEQRLVGLYRRLLGDGIDRSVQGPGSRTLAGA